jgi:hypothetical protein
VWTSPPPILILTQNRNNQGRASRGRGKRSAQRRNNELQVVHRPPVVRYTPNVFGFPDRLYTRLRYATVLSIVNTAGVLNSQIFRWNSTYDPDYTNTGHQPLYRDTYAGIYDHYAVVKAKITVRYDNNNVAVPYVVGLVTDDDATPSTAYQTLIEQSHGQSTSLTSISGSHSSHVLSSTWDCAQVLNIDPYTDQTYKTAVGANPSEDSYAIIWAQPFDGSSTASINLHITLEQEVLWTELTTPTQS